MRSAIALLICLLLPCSGCSVLRPAPVTQPRALTGVVHTVAKPGETLGAISTWYTGTPSNWRAIAAASGGIDERRLRIGQRVLVPEALLKTRTPMATAAVVRPAAPPPTIRPADWHGLGDYLYPDERARLSAR